MSLLQKLTAQRQDRTKPLSPKKSVSTTPILMHCSVSVYYFSANDDDEDEPTFKEKLLENVMKTIDILCVWDCCNAWLVFQKFVALVVFDPFVELFITLCIVVNTLFMALDHHDMNKELDKALKSGNYVRLRKLAEDVSSIWMLSVFHGYVLDRSLDEADRHESEVLFPRRMEHLRFHYRRVVFARARPGRRPGIVGFEIVQIGSCVQNRSKPFFDSACCS